MAKKAKGNRVQVIWNVQNTKTVECREHLVISQLRTERILQKDLS